MRRFGLVKIIILIVTTNLTFAQIVFPTTKPDIQSCTTSSEYPGQCYKGTRRCPGIISTSERPTYCPFQDGQIAVCCPIKSEPITEENIVPAPVTNFKCGERGTTPIIFGSLLQRRKRSSVKAVEPSRINLNRLKLGPNNPGDEVAVVGGVQSFRNSWPWMVLLGRKQGPTNVFFCSGSVLNQNYVITAAHCVLQTASFFARFAEHDQTILSITAPSEDIEITDIIFHPKYEIRKGYNDIALLKLVHPVLFRNEVKPICLPWGTLANEDLVNEKVTVTGWGTEMYGGRPSRVLREVIVDVFDPAVCNQSYSELRDFATTFPNGMSKDNIVCAGAIEGGKDTCQGDSGGPMVHLERTGIYTLAGIISKGYGCGLKDFPGIYAPLRNYDTLLWIKNTAF